MSYTFWADQVDQLAGGGEFRLSRWELPSDHPERFVGDLQDNLVLGRQRAALGVADGAVSKSRWSSTGACNVITCPLCRKTLSPLSVAGLTAASGRRMLGAMRVALPRLVQGDK